MTALGTGAAGSVPKPCPEHGAPDEPTHRYCEVCGRELERVPLGEAAGASGRATTETGLSVPAGAAWPAAPAQTGGTESTGSPELAESTELLRLAELSGPSALSRLEALAGPSVPSRPLVGQSGPAVPSGRSRPPAPPGATGPGSTGSSAPAGWSGTTDRNASAEPGGQPVTTNWRAPSGPIIAPATARGSAPAAPPGTAGWSPPAHVSAETPGNQTRGHAAPPGPTGPGAAPGPWLSSRAVDQPCPACGAPTSGGSGHCDHCGRRSSVGRDRADLDLGPVAGVTDRARRRRNEDAIVIGRLGQTIAAVVCDGVSTSLRADLAAHAAAEAGLSAMLSALANGAPGPDATVVAGRAAAGAARATAASDDGQVPPSCTFVSAVVTPGSVTVGWIGDSRAYWLGPDGAVNEAVCLTVDDSVVGQIRAGRPVPPGAELDPTSKALIRWLGADSADAEPQVVSFQPARPGRLVICSDGLSHYLPNAAALAARTPGPQGGTPIAIARDLTRFAVEAGGHDNIAVAVLPFPPVVGTGGQLP